MNILSQIIIFIFGVSAIFMSQSDVPKINRYACIVALIAQPFWFYTSWTHQQYGIFIMSFFYTVAWGIGLKTHWFNSRPIIAGIGNEKIEM